MVTSPRRHRPGQMQNSGASMRAARRVAASPAALTKPSAAGNVLRLFKPLDTREFAMVLSGAEILIRCLQEEKVEYVFGYPGGSVLFI